MLRTYLYLPDELENQILMMVKLHGKRKAVVIREALMAGIDVIKSENNPGISTLDDLAKISEKYRVKGPKDLSENMDHYLWGMPDEN